MKNFIIIAGLGLGLMASTANAAVSVGVGISAPVYAQYAEPVPVQPYCRPVRQDVLIGNRIRSTYYTACLQPNGVWAPINQPAYLAPVPGATVAYVQPEPVIEGGVIIGIPGWYHGHYWNGRHWGRDHEWREHEHERERR